MEKHPEHQKELFHNFIDFKKAFGRVWHDGLWRVLKGYNIDNRLIKSSDSCTMKRPTQCCLMAVSEISFERLCDYTPGGPLSPVLFNIFLENIMQKSFTPQLSIQWTMTCFAGDEAEDVEETVIPLSSVYIEG